MENIIEILDHFLYDPWMFNSGSLIRVIKLFIPACLKDMTSRRWNFPFPQLPLLLAIRSFAFFSLWCFKRYRLPGQIKQLLAGSVHFSTDDAYL